MHNDESLSAIGSDLLSFAEEHGAPNRLPLTTQLFPFLHLASRRMTTREMSGWLETNKGVKLSGPMISKGLQRPDLHLRRIAEHLQPLAAYVAAVHNVNAEWLLFEEDPDSGQSAFKAFTEQIENAPESPSDGIREALETLSESWDTIPQEVKFMCRRFFNFADSSADDDSDQSPTQEATR